MVDDGFSKNKLPRGGSATPKRPLDHPLKALSEDAETDHAAPKSLKHPHWVLRPVVLPYHGISPSSHPMPALEPALQQDFTQLIGAIKNVVSHA